MLIEPIPGNHPTIDGIGQRKRIMVCVQRYLPGYQSGGPVRAVANMIERLGEKFEFFVITRDRDAAESEPYAGVISDHWHRVGNAQVFYCSNVTRKKVKQAFHQVKPDIISLNSFQEHFTRIVMLLRKGGEFAQTPVVLAPRGEFSPGAMQIKRTKKTLYRNAAKIAGLHDNLHWQVSAPPEKDDLLRAAPARALSTKNIYVVSEMFNTAHAAGLHVPKYAGNLKLLFLSRISEMKNLDFLLGILPRVKGKIELDIFGPVAEWDTGYWDKCKLHLAKLPGNVSAHYHGPLDHSEVPRQLWAHHFFILPTKGENYCHAAVEAFVNGTPAILSDRTPWTGLREARAGFDIPLTAADQWVATLQHCVAMDPAGYAVYLTGASNYGARFSTDRAAAEHIAMFEAALADRS
jgi:glycosyltransferase involved in cell wall biosynthesis